MSQKVSFIVVPQSEESAQITTGAMKAAIAYVRQCEDYYKLTSENRPQLVIDVPITLCGSDPNLYYNFLLYINKNGSGIPPSYIFTLVESNDYQITSRYIFNVSIDAYGGDYNTIDSISAAIDFIYTNEAKYLKNPNSVSPILGKDLKITGASPYEVYNYHVFFNTDQGVTVYSLGLIEILTSA